MADEKHTQNEEIQKNQIEDKKIEREEESFADLFESYSTGMSEDIQVGDKISGKIISIGPNAIFVDTGTKIDGVVEREELLTEEGELSCVVGDILDLYVIAANESEIRLSKAISGIGGLNMLMDAQKSGIPVEGKVLQTCKGGFNVEVIKRRAFCPISQMDIKYVEEPNIYVGQSYQFLIKRIEENGRNIVISRRELLQQEQKKAQEKFLQNIDEETVLTGKVTRLMPYGAFVELIPGIEGMVHISELSWSRVEKPEEAVKPGDQVKVRILKITSKAKSDQKKISLSMKQVGQNPWETVQNRFEVGTKVEGKVTRCMKFGAFVEIEEGVEGLVHISEMSYTKRVIHPEDEVKPGQTVWVMIKEIDMTNKRISLSLRDAVGDPWADVNKKFSVGQSVEGTLEKKESFGYFVNLEPGITGLLPISKIKASENAPTIERTKVGGALSVVIEGIQVGQRKISLGTGEAKVEEDWRQFSTSSKSSLGSLGEQLQQALKQKQK
ncbi:MAG: 30S ribosomal protein S1 [Desulfobacteraceae bacterium]